MTKAIMYFKIIVPPLLAGLIAFSTTVYFEVDLQVNQSNNVSSIGGFLCLIAITMLVLILASLAILVKIENTNLIKIMKQSGHYKDLLITLFFGCILQSLCILIGFRLIFFSILDQLFFCILVCAEVAAVCSFLQIGRKLWLVLTNLNSD